ncbi:hypothetical protein X801_07280, partial [Opisthorchis viverrini]
MPLFGIDRMLSTDRTRFGSRSDTISWKEEYALFERGMREFRSLTEVFKSTTRFASLLGDAMSISELLVAYKLSSRLCEKIVEKIVSKSTGIQSKNTTANLDDQTDPRNAKIKLYRFGCYELMIFETQVKSSQLKERLLHLRGETPLSREEEPILNAMQKENCPPADPSQKKWREEVPAKIPDNPGQDREDTVDMSDPNRLCCKLEDQE